MTPCNKVDRYKHFGVNRCFLLQGRKLMHSSIIKLEAAVSLGNISFLKIDRALQSTRH